MKRLNEDFLMLMIALFAAAVSIVFFQLVLTHLLRMQ